MGKNKSLRAQETIILLDIQVPEQSEVNLQMSCKRHEWLGTVPWPWETQGILLPLKEASRWWLRVVFSLGFWVLQGLRTGVIKTGTWPAWKLTFYMFTTNCLSFTKILWEAREILQNPYLDYQGLKTQCSKLLEKYQILQQHIYQNA